ncbi:MAG TPA: AMP-binding protein, partial [Pyrinomonadaceae bacterium]
MQEELTLTAEVEGFQLSPQQDRLWLLQGQGGEPGDAGPYRAVGVVEVAGELRPAALREAAHRVVARHEILRTAFRCLPGMTTPLQVVVPDAAPAWESVSLLGLSPAAQAEEVARLRAEERERPFDLTTGAALRVTHVALGPRAHNLLLSLPALCADTQTLDALTAELARAYAACDADAADAEADEPLQYARLAAWQTELLTEAEAAQREFWQRRSAPSLWALAPPGERKHAAAGPFRPASVSIRLGPETLHRVRSAAAAHGASVEVFLLACWQTQLWRLTGNAEFVVGYLTGGRPFEELRGAPGLLARWLPLAVQFSAATSFGALLRQTHQAVAEAEDAQAAFVWPHSGRVEPAAGDFPACGFEFNGEFAAHAAGGLTFRLRSHHACVDRAGLTLVCAVEADALRAELRYDPAHYTAADVERLAGQYATLLSSATAAPAAPAAGLEMLGEAERRRLLVEWNETAAEYDRGVCLHQLFEAQAARTPERVAVVYEDEQLTYAELDARANQLARYLGRAGVGPEVLVGVCVDRSLELLVGLLGVLKAGGAYVPLDPAYPQERRDYMQRDAGVAVLLTQQHLLDVIPPTDAHVLCLDSDWERVAAEPTDSPAVAVGPDNLVYVIYTSGSTGRPKGAMLHHRGIVNCVAWMQATYRLDETDRFLLKTSLNFDPSVWEIFWPLAVGASVVVARPGGHRDADYLARTVARH